METTFQPFERAVIRRCILQSQGRLSGWMVGKDDRALSEERILWEIEPSRHLLEPNALPTPAHDGGATVRLYPRPESSGTTRT